MEQRLSLVTLGVADLAAARRFYEQGLGWKPHAASQESVAFYQLCGMAFALWSRADLAKDAQVEDKPTGFSGMSLAYNAHHPDEVDAVLQQAAAAGAKILKAAKATPWGGYSGYFADPDGHLWEVAHNPFWRIDEDGSIALQKAG